MQLFMGVDTEAQNTPHFIYGVDICHRCLRFMAGGTGLVNPPAPMGTGVECEIPLNDQIGIVANGAITYGVQDSLSYYSLSSLAAGLRYSPFPLSDRIRPYLCAYGGFFRELVGEYVDIYHPVFVPLAAAFVGLQLNSSSGACYGLEVGYLWKFRPGQAAVPIKGPVSISTQWEGLSCERQA